MSSVRGLSSFTIFTPNVATFVLMLLINTNFSRQNVISVKRSSSRDVVDVKVDKLICDDATVQRLCIDKYNGLSGRGLAIGRCTCECNGLLAPTFYSKQLKCVSNQAVVDDNQCSINVKEGASYSSLSILDTHVSMLRELHLGNGLPKQCSRVEATWYYYQHNTWNSGTPNIFSVVANQTKNTFTQLLENLNNVNKTWVLQISGSLPDKYKGLLIKVELQCKFDHEFAPPSKCVMFKTLGTHQVVPPPPSTAPPSTTQPSTSTPSTSKTSTTPSTTPSATLSSTERKPETGKISTTATNSPTTASVSPTTANNPNTEPYIAGNNGRIWIVFVAGGVTFLVVLALGGVVMFLLVRRHRRKKHKTENIVLACTRPDDSTGPTDVNIASPPHDYEYVVYPALTEGYQPSVSNTLDNASYGRGPDNELIIRTPGFSSDSLKSRNTNSSTKSSNYLGTPSAAIADYTHLHDQNDAEHGIYQPLIRPHTPEVNDHGPEGDNRDEGQKQYMEIIHVDDDQNTPEYMVLEPVNSEDQNA